MPRTVRWGTSRSRRVTPFRTSSVAASGSIHAADDDEPPPLLSMLVVALDVAGERAHAGALAELQDAAAAAAACLCSLFSVSARPSNTRPGPIRKKEYKSSSKGNENYKKEKI